MYPKARVSTKLERGGVILTPALASQYDALFNGATLTDNEGVNQFVDQLLANRDRYQAVSGQIPTALRWYFVGIIHGLECSFDFSQHLYNGDPLTARTVDDPAGRPTQGEPPFEWEFSAYHALVDEKLNQWTDWSLAGTLYRFESYNGFGYRIYHPSVNSPYLWSFTNQYTKGKYDADGDFDPNLVSEECGAAAALLSLIQRGIIPSLT